jgi:hypothetical protein
MINKKFSSPRNSNLFSFSLSEYTQLNASKQFLVKWPDSIPPFSRLSYSSQQCHYELVCWRHVANEKLQVGMTTIIIKDT